MSEKLGKWIILVFVLTLANVGHGETWQVGFGKADITPTEPLRLSGYAVRNKPFEGIQDPLATRAMVLRQSSQPETASLVLVSLDSIAVTSAMTLEIATWLDGRYQVPRSQLVLSSSHSHAAPHLYAGLNNLFREELTETEVAGAKRYTEFVVAQIKQAIEQAFDSRKEAEISIGVGKASFAIQRRLIEDGKWKNFGEVADGSVDRAVRVLGCRDGSGKLIGAAYMYACHCTTLGPDFNKVSGDWAGLSASRLEEINSGAIFLPMIGCGADANPTPRNGYDFAVRHAAEMVDVVSATLKGSLTAITEAPVAHFGHAGLAPEIPSQADLDRTAAQPANVNEKRWAEHMKHIKATRGRLPETVPMPIHTWQFGKQLTWVFLGGEVVSEYQAAIAASVGQVTGVGHDTWVAAYCDDVFAYVASERMRAEGGYEVDYSMIYYMQPGRWQAGTQDVIERRVTELLSESQAEGQSLTASQALDAIHVPKGYRVELVAAEPLVQDPINIAFSPDGSVWVVEMADYPLGSANGGRIKRLVDTDGDGKLDQATTFLNGLSFPTSVQPWRDGVLVIAAPDVLFAKDTNGDGVADEREVLLSGIAEANPQHRASGFEVGLDGWLHFGAGDGTKELFSKRANQTYQVAHRDLAWNPDTGQIITMSGDTQFTRNRDDFGNWFGNSNSYPIFHYVIDTRYQTETSISGESKQHLLTPAVAPPVKPRSRTVDRFNDLYAHNRFTSACSAIICRSPGLGPEMQGAAIVCEPVHNLVARFKVNEAGGSFTGSRFDEDDTFDFFTSTDEFCRPVRAVNAPDGTLWIVDMSRQVIEHPEWIPMAWQERLNLRSGERLGRIYRVYREGFQPNALRSIGDKPSDLLPSLASDSGGLRTLAQLRILWADSPVLVKETERIAIEHPNAAVRATALGTLAGRKLLTPVLLGQSLQDRDHRVVRLALELSEPLLAKAPELQQQVIAVAAQPRSQAVDLQWLLTTMSLKSADKSAQLQNLAARSLDNTWIVRGLSLCNDADQAAALARGLVLAIDQAPALPTASFAEMQQCITRLWTKMGQGDQSQLLDRYLKLERVQQQSSLTQSQLLLLTAFSEADSGKTNSAGAEVIRAVTQSSMRRMMDISVDEQERLALVNLLGCGVLKDQEALAAIEQLVDPRQLPSIQVAAVMAARRLNSSEVPTLLLRVWQKLIPETRLVATATFLTRKPWAEQLVGALESGVVKTTDIDVAGIQQLKSFGDRTIRIRCEKVFGKPTPRATVVTDYVNRLPKDADTQAGKALFLENCAVCHQPAEGKPMIGPPIDNLGHWTAEQWIVAVMDPNRTIEPKFHQYQVLTRDGQVLAGIIQQRSAQSVRIAGTDGSVKEVPIGEVEEMRDAGVSLMPEGLESKLSPEQLAALIAYLRTR